MTRYKLLVTDLDGTLLDAHGRVHPLELGIAGPVGCLDGSQVVDTRDDQPLATHPIAEQAADPLLEALGEFDPVTFVFAEDTVLHDARGDAYLSFISIWSRRAQRLANGLRRSHFGGEKPVSALVSLGSAEQIRSTAARIQELAGGVVQIAFFNVPRPELDATMGMVVRAAGVDKSTAMRRIAEHYGISLEQTVAVGDWVNDLAMLSAAGKSFAMGQAPAAVKAAAHEVLEADSTRGGGIAEAAERAGLLRPL
jgi:hydroxymethylpyrimidine pyrophosphatase-like HAD family hydrolase